MDYVQLFNGVASFVTAAIWLQAMPGTIKLHQRFVAPITAVCFGTTVWYGTVNIALGFDLWSPANTVPLFRWGFSLIVLAPAARMLATNKLRKALNSVETPMVVERA